MGENRFFTYLIFCILMISCSSDKNIRTYKLEKKQISKSVIKDHHEINTFNDLGYVTPDAWIPSSGSSMRLLSFSIPYSKGLGDLSVIKLNSKGGGLQSNVNRWRRQLDLPALSIDEIKKEISIMTGKHFNYEMIELINDEDGRSFLCAIFFLDENTYFVKASLNMEGISEIKSDFIKFCSSLKFPN
ncbi:MAG: hypothetical protein VX820_04785 [Candidatus Neomarinimicrobiota bacterium]|nr:hypothetical protein [Candidatus Neomarinimicrobiota bacterium]|tara:strand:+ start:4064 stop:4624 length:561 start_codon:yes stop_codon:yes gene_type:complete